MRIRVIDTIGELADDLTAITVDGSRDMADTVKKNVDAGTRYARGFARQAAGPHGKAFYKRIDGEMTGPMEGEFGPEGEPKTEFVGAGFRHGGPNMDLAKAADLVGPRFARDVAALPDRWFW